MLKVHSLKWFLSCHSERFKHQSMQITVVSTSAWNTRRKETVPQWSLRHHVINQLLILPIIVPHWSLRHVIYHSCLFAPDIEVHSPSVKLTSHVIYQSCFLPPEQNHVINQLLLFFALDIEVQSKACIKLFSVNIVSMWRSKNKDFKKKHYQNWTKEKREKNCPRKFFWFSCTRMYIYKKAPFTY